MMLNFPRSHWSNLLETSTITRHSFLIWASLFCRVKAFGEMKNHQRYHHCVACLDVGVRVLNYSLKCLLGGPRACSCRSMPGKMQQWLVFLLHRTCWCLVDHKNGMFSLVSWRRGCVTLLNCGRNLLKQLMAPRNLWIACLFFGVGMASRAWTVAGLGWRPSVVIT